MCLDIVRKKLSIRSWRRCTKELDLILGRFSDGNIRKFEKFELDVYKELLSNDDHLIYSWLFEKEETPEIFKLMVKKIQESMGR